MATSDAPLNVPNVTLAVARGGMSVAPAVITGTGFGSKLLGFVSLDDFESEALGQIGNTVGNLSVSNFAGGSIASGSISGTRCLQQDYSQNGFPKIYKALSGQNPKGYMALYFKWSGTNSLSTVWKFGRVGANAVYGGDPKFGESYTGSSIVPTSFGGEVRSANGLTGFGGSADILKANPETVYTADTWHFYEFEWDAGTTNGNDSFFEVRCDNTIMVRFVGAEFLTTADSSLPAWILTVLNGLDQNPNIQMLMDDVYIDESRARVVITDSQVYANSTAWVTQEITSWSDTEISISKRQGQLSTGTNYAHVWNEAGVKIGNGIGVNF